ncbi:MAG: hypothetical protein ACREBV_06130, partial [Candidatus Zixiibacteriota bacterium]
QQGVVVNNIKADVGNANGAYTEDISGSLRSQGIGYIIDNDGDFGGPGLPATKIFSAKFLSNSFNASDTNFSWWISNGIPAQDFGPRLRPTAEDPFYDFGTGGTGTPEGDKNKYYLMRHKEWDYDQVFNSTVGENDSIWMPPPPFCFDCFSSDAKFLISITPFDLKPDSSIRVLFATFTGDSVHTNPDAIDYLPNDPVAYLNELNFIDVVANSAISDSLAQILLNPNLPPLGLELVHNQTAGHELQWDPWVYGEVTGYELYIDEADLNQLPHPGAVPPWWKPSSETIPITVEPTHRLNIDWLDSNSYYVAQIRHQIGEGAGELSVPIGFRLDKAKLAPKIPLSFVAAPPGQPVKLVWNNPETELPHHFNIYKFSDSNSAKNAFHPFYDKGYQSQFIQPTDSFYADDTTYYFYAMEPYAIVNGSDSQFFDNGFVEGDAYKIVSADENGFESEFSKTVTAFQGAEKINEILVITNAPVLLTQRLVFEDSIFSFYDGVLNGFAYNLYSLNDTLSKSGCFGSFLYCDIWRDLLPYKLVIFDDRMSTSAQFYAGFNYKIIEAFEKLLANGCKLAVFGTYLTGAGSLVEGDLPLLSFIPDFTSIFGVAGRFQVNERFYS